MKTLVALFVLVALAGCTGDPPVADGPGPRASTTPPARSGCGSPVRTDALPEWARSGCTGDGGGVAHVYGDRGEILGILFGGVLRSAPAPDRGNKILWVSRQPVEHGDRLRIAAELDGTTVRADREVPGGPGPSLIDLPRPGCWHLTLSWSGRTDTMDLTYDPDEPPSSSLLSRPAR